MFVYYLNLIIMDIWERLKSYNKITNQVVKVKRSETLGEWAVFCFIEVDLNYVLVFNEADTSNVVPKVGDMITVIEIGSKIKRVLLNGKILWSVYSARNPIRLIF